MAKKTVQKKEAPAKAEPVKEIPQEPKPMIAAPEHKSNSYGITSLVLGILSILTPPFGLVFGIVGLIFGIKQNHTWKNHISTGGFITSIVGICLSVVVLIALIIIAAFFAAMLPLGFA